VVRGDLSRGCSFFRSCASVFVFEPPDQMFEFFYFLLCFIYDLFITSSRSSVKYVKDTELLCCLILIAEGSYVTLLASIVVFHCVFYISARFCILLVF
jgi:hypothetical protein